MIKAGELFFPDGEVHFLRFGYDAARYQQTQRDFAFRYVKDWFRAVDVGAHIGIFSRHFAERFEEVWAFEPVPTTRECLELNAPKNVAVKPYALGNAARRNKMYRVRKNSGASFICDDSSIPVPLPKMDKKLVVDVEVRALDDFELDPLGLIKIDIQGGEYNALLGAQETLKRCRPVVLIEEKPVGGPDGETAHIGQSAALLESVGMTPKERVGGDRIYVFE